MRIKGFCATLLALVSLSAMAVTRVDVTSQPDGATVIIDGQHRGVTPITLFDLKPGRHRFQYSLAGYVTQNRFREVVDNEPTVRCVVMEPVMGLLLVKSTPEGCNVAIDGISFGQTPCLVTTLTAKDEHKVTLRKAGYRTSTFSVKFDGRRPIVHEEALVLDSGIISVQSEPVGAEVTINGISRGKAPLIVGDIPKGLASVKFTMPGFKDEVRELNINAGDRQTLSIVMTGLPGTLMLSSVPEGARFYVNGEFRGKDPIVVVSSLPPGEYQVKAEKEGYGTLTKTINIGNGDSPREEFRLSNTMGRIELRSSPAGAAVFFDGRQIGTTKEVDRDSEFSAVFPIENVYEGEHVLVLKKDGYSDATRHPKIHAMKTSQANIRMRRIFKPNVRIITESGSYDGILISNSGDYVTVEVKLGIQRSFSKSDIRKMEFLK